MESNLKLGQILKSKNFEKTGKRNMHFLYLVILEKDGKNDILFQAINPKEGYSRGLIFAPTNVDEDYYIVDLEVSALYNIITLAPICNN